MFTSLSAKDWVICECNIKRKDSDAFSSRDEKVNMAAAHTAGIDGITKVLESICRERRRENLDKESEGNYNTCR